MPHAFYDVNCKKCDERFCPVCKDDKCPKCGEVDIGTDKVMRERKQMRDHMNRNKK